jgi:hypothetical protein
MTARRPPDNRGRVRFLTDGMFQQASAIMRKKMKNNFGNSQTLDRYFHAYGTFVLVVSGSLEANGMKKLIEIVYNLLVEAIQLCSFVVGNFGVSPVRLQ